MNVLVIGGTGLISTAITRFLFERGDNVTIYNRGKTTANIPSNVKRIVGDRRKYPFFERQMEKLEPFDCVIDMVCFLPEEAESTIRAFRHRARQYIFCSTVDVYTKPAKKYPVREEAEKRPSPSFTYAYNKAECEKLFFEAHNRNDFFSTIIRPAYTYGEGAGIVHTLGWETYFIDRLIKGLPLIVHGDGTSFWVACHRDDVAKAFVNAVGNEKAFGRAYNVTGDEWMTWNRYYQIIAESLNAPEPELVHIPTEVLGTLLPKRAEWCVKNFSYNNIFDNTAAKVDLGFHYTITWSEGVKRVVNWLEGHGLIEKSGKYPFYDKIITRWRTAVETMKSELTDVDI
ncbi:MAG: NAD-dependent epimerase/dehydratase family protein [Thermoproteota archaeon]